MPDFITTQQPEVILSAVCGPGATLRKEGLPLFLYAVYSFPAYMHTGFPDCAPRADSKKIADLVRDKTSTKAFKKHITGFFVMRDDEFIRSLWRGGLWPVVSIFSPICEAFSEGGGYILQNRDKFLTRDTVKRWMGSALSEKDISPSLAWDFAKKVLTEPFDTFVEDPKPAINRIADPEARSEDKKTLHRLYTERKNSIPPRMDKKELNNFLITVRGLS